MGINDVTEWARKRLTESVVSSPVNAAQLPAQTPKHDTTQNNPRVLPTPGAQDRGEVPDWHALDAAYQLHHIRCPVCQAAGRGTRYGMRCGTGAALWRA